MNALNGTKMLTDILYVPTRDIYTMCLLTCTFIPIPFHPLNLFRNDPPRTFNTNTASYFQTERKTKFNSKFRAKQAQSEHTHINRIFKLNSPK